MMLYTPQTGQVQLVQLANSQPILELGNMQQLAAAQNGQMNLQQLYVLPKEYQNQQRPAMAGLANPMQYQNAQFRAPILPLQQLWEVEQKNETTTTGNVVTKCDVQSSSTGGIALKAAAFAVVAFLGMQF